MKKFIISLVIAVFAVEFLLAYLKLPIADMGNFMTYGMITAVLLFAGFVLFIFSRDRQHERTLAYQDRQRERDYSTQVVQTFAALTNRQMDLLDRLYEQGAQLHQLPNGNPALVVEGKYKEISPVEARYFLTGETE